MVQCCLIGTDEIAHIYTAQSILFRRLGLVNHFSTCTLSVSKGYIAAAHTQQEKRKPDYQRTRGFPLRGNYVFQPIE